MAGPPGREQRNRSTAANSGHVGEDAGAPAQLTPEDAPPDPLAAADAARVAAKRAVEASKQLDFAKDAVTQVLTLSTAIVAISLTFSHNWVADTPEANTAWLKASWIALLAAIVMGLWALLALTGLAYSGRASVFTRSFRIPWALELLSFPAALSFLLVFGWQTVNSR
jgi:hypothetical protein